MIFCQRLTVLTIVVLAAGVQGFDVSVRWNEERQTMRGFGGGTACPGCSPDYCHSGSVVYNMPEPTRSNAMDLLFDTISGIGLNNFRLGENWNLEDPDGTWHWAPTHNDETEIWFAEEAMKRNPNIDFWTAPWTPPLWMKTVQSMGGGELQRQYYQRYADYKSRLVRGFIDEGIPIMANSVQNEPHFPSPSYGGCGYSSEQLRDFVRDYLGPTFERDGIGDVTIMIPESNWPQPQWARATLDDPEASKYIGILGWHQYQDGNQPFLGSVEGKETWFTEASHAPWSGDGNRGWSEALWRHTLLYDAIVDKDGSAWAYYKFAGGAGAALMLAFDGQYYSTKGFWWIGHYSKFIRPGWVRVETSVRQVSDGAKISAFKDPVTGRFAIVIANHGISKPGPSITFNCNGFNPRKVTPYLTPGEDAQGVLNMVQGDDLDISNGTFTYQIPNVSIATLVGETQDPTLVQKPAATSVPRMSVSRVPEGLSIHTGPPQRGRAELVDCHGRLVERWELNATAEQTLRFSTRLAAGVHLLKVVQSGRTTQCMRILN